MAAFPLFRLPSLVLCETLDYMELLEQYNLSEVSAKARLIVKNFLAQRRSKFSLSINCSSSFRLEFGHQEDGLIVNSIPDESQLKIWIEYFADFFNISQVSLEFDERPHTFVKNIIETIKKVKLRIETANVISNKTDDELNKFVLDECRNVSNLYIKCETTTNFQYNHNHGEPLQCDFLRIFFGKWITEKHLVNLFIDCKKVILDKCGYVTYNELKTFLARWIQGCKLEYIQFPDGGYVFSSMFADLSATNVNRVKVDGQIQNFRDGKCYLIRNINGKEAVVYREEKINGRGAIINPRASADFILTTDFEL